MARIRSIKPEFWDSPSTAKASPWARLLFIAMWNWADDYGRGTANLKELEGFAFPHDDEFTDSSGNTVHFRSLVAEVSECFGVVFYSVSGRLFYEIPTWDEHQRNERRSKQSKHPGPELSSQVTRGEAVSVAEIPCNRAELTGNTVTGTGEQGNRGTGEQIYPAISETKTKPKKAKTVLPPEWVHTEAHEAKAKEFGIDLHLEVEKFKAHAEANDRKLASWNAGFTQWLIQAKGYQQPQQAQAQQQASLWTREGPF